MIGRRFLRVLGSLVGLAVLIAPAHPARQASIEMGVQVVNARSAPAARQRRDAEPAADPAFGFRDLYVFPEPPKVGERTTLRLQTGMADAVDLAVYDLSGRRVHSSSLADPKIIDDRRGKGPQYTYDFPWDPVGVEPGIYIYSLNARKRGKAGIQRFGKLVLLGRSGKGALIK